ncbi:MAG: hypothetical protein HQL86_06100 [Magnetococcales bacterium]|nr:hypothetical protein [Magnetococcales bacterium]
MSEYQYYEFLAVDRPLDADGMASLRALSSRAKITPTGFVNHYDFGDFKGNPDRLVERYFDFFLYLANWGSRQLQIRIPERFLNADLVKKYCPGDNAAFRRIPGYFVLDYTRNPEDGGEWDFDDDGQGRLAALAPVRESLMRGDLRLLYLGWLLAAQEDVLEEDTLEPDPPPGLGQLNGPMLAFADFIGIDRDLVEAAGEGIEEAAQHSLSREKIVTAIGKLAEQERCDFLCRLALQEESNLALELLHRLENIVGKNRGKQQPGRRTVGELFARAEAIRDTRQRIEKERQAAEQARREQMQIAAWEKRLQQLAGRESEVWREVETLIAAGSAKPYDLAVTLLLDLQELAARSGQTIAFAKRIVDIRQRSIRKTSLIDRLNKAGLPQASQGMDR